MDIDECKQRPSPCQHECENTFGSFKCSCPPGYKLNQHTNTCMDVDECSLEGGTKCEYECLNTPGGYECVCPPGFSQLGHRCLDIDECVEQQGLCPSPGTCKNTNGRYAHKKKNIISDIFRTYEYPAIHLGKKLPKASFVYQM